MSPFAPLPLLSNPHVQTVLGSWLPTRHRPPRALKRLVPLPDGDCIVLHETPPTGNEAMVRKIAPLAVLIHGLGGSHESPYMPRMTRRLSGLGWRVFRMDLRGAGAGLPFARRIYTAACSDDVRAVVDHLITGFPGVPIAVLGFSLGGNIVLKYAGEIGGQAPPSLRAVTAIAPPIDLLRCSDKIMDHPWYDAFFVHLLTRQVARHQQTFPDVPRVVFPRGTKLRQFDDLYTAPRWGYAGAIDYYRRASAYPFINGIHVPTFVLAARDDPFIAIEPFEALQAPSSVEVHIAAHGGHLGFLGCDGNGGIRWAETQLVNWLMKII
jgi:predicted alpha/beta-fold hydrolase